MGKIRFEKTNGGIYVPPAGKDHVSGILTFLAVANIPTAFTETGAVKKVTSIEAAEALGIVAVAGSENDLSILHYHVSEVFRMNASCELYIGIYPTIETAYTFAEVKTMQRFANGDIRQCAVYLGSKELAALEVTALQTVATALEAEAMPLSIIYAADVKTSASLPDLQSGGRANVAAVIGEDMGGVAATLVAEVEQSVTCIGAVLGALSKAKVQQSIGWVQMFPMGIDAPGLCDGTALEDIDPGSLFGSGSLEEKGYIFLRRYPGVAGSYLNDSRTLDLATSDYSHIERVRTIDKAVRGIRYNLTPHINSNVRIDAESGKIAADAVAFLETVANRALEDMEKAGELSGYQVLIDPNQNVLGSGVINFVIQNVPMAVVREYSIKIGFTSNI